MGENNYFGRALNLIPAVQHNTGTSVRSGIKYSQGNPTAILVLDVASRAAGQITAIKIYIHSPDGRSSSNEIAVYTFGSLTISSAGVYAFLISPNGGAAAGWTSTPIQGVMPPTFEAEVVYDNGTDMVFSLWDLLSDY